MKHKFFEMKKKEALYKERELQWLAQSGLLELDSLEEGVDEDEEGQDYSAFASLQSRHRNRNGGGDHLQNKSRIIRYVGGGFRAIPHLDINR